MAPNHQFEKAESVSHDFTFQDGKHSESQGCAEKKRFHGQDRLEGCVLDGASTSLTQEIPAIRLEEWSLPIQGPSLWSVDCSENLHEASTANSSEAPGTRSPPRHLPGRLSVDGRLGRKTARPHPDLSESSAGTGFCAEHEEMCSGSEPGYRIFGVHSELPTHDLSPPGGENGEDQEGVSSPLEQATGIRQGFSPLDWPANVHHTSLSPCPTPLQGPTEAQEQSTLSFSLLRPGDRAGRRCEERPPLLDQSNAPLERETHHDPHCRGHHNIRCFNIRLGCQLWNFSDRGTVDTFGISNAHQHAGVKSSLPSSTDICSSFEEPAYLAVDRQSNCHCIPQSQRRYMVEAALRPGSRGLGLVPAEESHNSCGTHSGQTEHDSRHGVSQEDGFQRLEVESRDFLCSHAEIGTMQYRPIRSKAQHPARKIFQFQTRSTGRSYGCIGSEVGSTDSLCLSSFHSGWQGLAEDEAGVRTAGSGDCTTLAIATVVSSAVGHADGLPNSSAPDSYIHNQSERRTTSLDEAGPSSVGRLESLWQRIGNDISKESFELMSAAWRKGTEKSYSSAWKRWSSWCSQRGCNPISPSIGQILQFLTEEFQNGKEYSTINSYRSALSATLPAMDGCAVGQHPLVCRLLQGVFNKRPPAPRYQNVWNVSTVIVHILRLPTDLSLKDLTKKLAMLLALTNASRSSDLHALDLRFRSFTGEGVLFRIPGLTKTRRSGPPKEAMFPAFEENSRLCPVNTLKQYEQMTASLRGAGSASHQLFVSIRKPHNPVTSATIARWLKTLLSEAGVDTEMFKAHSTRAAASSTAKNAGASTADILKMAGWSRSSTFERFYHKPIVGSNRVLSYGVQGESLNDTMSYMQLATTWNCRFHKHPRDAMWNRNSISGKANI